MLYPYFFIYQSIYWFMNTLINNLITWKRREKKNSISTVPLTHLPREFIALQRVHFCKSTLFTLSAKMNLPSKDKIGKFLREERTVLRNTNHILCCSISSHNPSVNYTLQEIVVRLRINVRCKTHKTKGNSLTHPKIFYIQAGKAHFPFSEEKIVNSWITRCDSNSKALFSFCSSSLYVTCITFA